MFRQRVEQPLRHAIRIRIQEAHPIQPRDARQAFQQLRQTIPQIQVFAVRRRVLPDQCNLAHACGRQIGRLAHHGFETTAAEFSAELGNDAKRARVIATLGNLNVSGMARCRQHARGGVVIQERRKCDARI